MRTIAPSTATAAWVATLRAEGLTLVVEPGVSYLVDGLQERSTLVARDAACTVLFDGILRNRADLRAQLECAPGAVGSDAELVLQVYRRWGEEMLPRLRGAFALILWDGTRAVGLAVRDEAGVYPVFYAQNGHQVLLSTSVEALIGHPRVSGEVNRAAVADYLCRRSHDLEETYFSCVRRIPPAHVLRQRNGHLSVRRYWHPAISGTTLNGADDIVERFSSVLTRVVGSSVLPESTGILLSGGLDSGALAAITSEVSRGQGRAGPLAVSVVFPHTECNEEPIQRAVAATLGLDQVMVDFDDAVGPGGMLPAALQVNAEWPTPLVSAWSPVYRELAGRAAGRGCHVLLSGTGGDEWLSVGMEHGTDLLRTGEGAGLLEFMALVRRAWPVSRARVGWTVLWKFGVRVLLRRAAARTLRRMAPAALRRYRLNACARPAWLAPDPDLRREIERRLETRVEITLRGRERATFREQVLEETLTSVVFPRVLEELFETGRRAGVRILVPYWDADVVELLYPTPFTLLGSGGRTKGLLRAVLAQRLPGLGFERQRKVGAHTFFRSRLFAEAPASWARMGGTRALAGLGIVDPRFDAVIEAAIARRNVDQTYLVWDGLTAEAWVRGRLGFPAAAWREGHG